MAKIDEYLQKILSSRYGKDVRGAIHDSIDEINKVNEANISTVQSIANTAQGYADNAEDSKDLAEQAVTDAQAQVTLANTARTGAETAEDGAEHFYQETLAIAQTLGSALIPKGTVEFANLPSVSSSAVKDGFMWNISDPFTTTSDFVEGAGLSIPMGANVYKVTINNAPKWDILAGSSAQVFTGTEAQIAQAIQQGLLGEGVMINSLDDGEDELLTTSMISHDGDSLENKLDDIDDTISQLNESLSMLTEVTVSDYSSELQAYDRIYVKDKSKVYIKGRFVGNFTVGVEKKMFNVSQTPKLDFTTNPNYVMFNCVISGSSTAPAYGYIKPNGDVCVIPSESITNGTCILAFDYQY